MSCKKDELSAMACNKTVTGCSHINHSKHLFMSSKKYISSSVGYIMITSIMCIYSYNCFGIVKTCFSELCLRKEILATDNDSKVKF